MEKALNIMQELNPEWFIEVETSSINEDLLQQIVHTTYSECDEFYIMYADLFFDRCDAYYLRQMAKVTEGSEFECNWYKSVDSKAVSDLCDSYNI